MSLIIPNTVLAGALIVQMPMKLLENNENMNHQNKLINTSFTLLAKNHILKLKTCRQAQTLKFPWTNPSGVGKHFKEYFRLGQVGEFYFGSVRVGVFFTGRRDILSQDFRINLHLNPNLSNPF